MNKNTPVRTAKIPPFLQELFDLGRIRISMFSASIDFMYQQTADQIPFKMRSFTR
ncbi:hypothetical protein AR1Y2_1161 [Anaerostipes rhamnosivorans]|uniref:Uncharacterized protein n=1 Tax=Anaerostipes rhamnosivorans TaxID=1229621 RepID=A0A4P8ID14_9FIRM|nr:hypothetical protein AR1Y2_1161 [Anaerostipes rhamnosivorans]